MVRAAVVRHAVEESCCKQRAVSRPLALEGLDATPVPDPIRGREDVGLVILRKEPTLTGPSLHLLVEFIVV